MTSQLSSLLESRKIEDLLAVAAEGNLPNAKIANVQGRNADIDTSAEDVTEIGGNYAPPTAARVHAIVSDSVEDGDDANAATGTITVADYAECAAKAATGSITFGAPDDGDTVEVDGNTFTKMTRAAATGSITFNTPVDGDTVIVNGVTLTKVAAAPAAFEFTNIAELEALVEAVTGVNSSENGTVVSITAATAGAAGNSITLDLGGGNAGDMAISGATLTGGTDPAANEFETIEELTALIEALATVGATDNGTTITITATTAGTGGNSLTLSVGGGNTGTLAVSGATLTGGEAVVTVTVNGVAFVAGTDFTAETDNDTTAQNIADAINASVDVLVAGIVTASVVNAVVTITADTAGAAGNSITLATTEAGAVAVSGANLTGGDDANTTGVLSVRITGVSSTYAEITEDVTLGGTVAVNTVNSYLRINSMVALTVGSNGSAVGNITATAATDSTVSAKIAAGENESRNAFYTVPLNKTGFVFSMFGEMYGAASTIVATVEMLVREYGKGWVSRGVCSVNGGEENGRKFSAPISVPAKADIKLRAATSADNADIVAGMQMLVVADL